MIFSFSGFKEYLETAPTYDFPQYRQLVHDITQTLNNISNEVIAIEVKLRENGQTSIGDIIRKIQLKEKEKLEMVSYLQLKENYMFIMCSLLGAAGSLSVINSGFCGMSLKNHVSCKMYC